MKRKIIGIILCLVLIALVYPLSISAGDEENPEIVDNHDDLFGALVEFPTRMRTRIALIMLQIDTFEFVDIDSAWFYEKQTEPDFLFMDLKIKDLKTYSQRAIYSIHWKYNGVGYAVGSHIFNNGRNYSCFVGLDRRYNQNWQPAEVIYDFDTNIVSFKIYKGNIGDPQSGDTLIQTFAWTALRFNREAWSLLFSDGELVKDGAPFLEDNDDYGLDYIIKY